MGWRFRRSVKILPGIRLNFGKRGVSTSIGVRGAHVTIGHGKARETVGIPGTGVSYTTTQGTHAEPPSEAPTAVVTEPLPKGKARRGWLWIALGLLIVAALVNGIARSNQLSEIPNVYAVTTPAPDQRGTQQQPLIVSKPKAELAQDVQDHIQQATSESGTALATIILALFTLLLWIANVVLVVLTKSAAAKQAVDTQRAIAELTRAANAMGDVATATKENAALMSRMLPKQMRAYIQVNIGRSTAQRERGERTVFGSRPEIVNVGLTPAKKVSYRVRAEILDESAAGAGFVFPEPELKYDNDATLNPRQVFTIQNAAVAQTFEPADVEAISKGDHKRLFVWGTVTYEDVYDEGVKRETRFSHNFVFFDQTEPITGKIEHKVNSFYSHGHNDAT
jgi:hypothetical protein